MYSVPEGIPSGTLLFCGAGTFTFTVVYWKKLTAGAMWPVLVAGWSSTASYYAPVLVGRETSTGAEALLEEKGARAWPSLISDVWPTVLEIWNLFTTFAHRKGAQSGNGSDTKLTRGASLYWDIDSLRMASVQRITAIKYWRIYRYGGSPFGRWFATWLAL